MTISVDIPEELAERLGVDADRLRRQAVEALALDAHRQGKLTEEELGRVLGFASRFPLERFLKEHGIDLAYTREDLEYERQVHKDLEAIQRQK